MFTKENLIQNNDHFNKFVKECLTEKIISIDTEFIRNDTFFSKLCLVQVGMSSGCYAIDPKKIDNFSLIKTILKKKSILKIFHSPRQDIEIFFNLFNSLPTNIFDTQLAYSFVDKEYQISYEKLVFKIFKHKLNKTFQYYKWDTRPLKTEHINYALNDVYYLRKLYFKLEKTLKKKNRYDWVLEESKIYLNKQLYTNDPKKYWKNIYPNKSKNINLKKLQLLCEWREKKCMNLNINRKLLFSDQNIIKVIKNHKSLKYFENNPNLSSFDLDFIKKILSKDNYYIPKKTTSNLDKNNDKLNALKIILKIISQEQNISQNLIATYSDLEKINFKTNKNSRLFKSWRNEIFGKILKKFFNNELKIISKNNKLYVEKN